MANQIQVVQSMSATNEKKRAGAEQLVSVQVDKMFAALEIQAEVFVARAVAALVRESAEQTAAREEKVAAAEAAIQEKQAAADREIQEKHAAADVDIQRKLAAVARTRQEVLALQAQLSQQQASLDRVRTQQEADGLWTKLAGCVAHEQDLVSFFEGRQLRSKSGVRFLPRTTHTLAPALVLRSQRPCLASRPVRS